MGSIPFKDVFLDLLTLSHVLSYSLARFGRLRVFCAQRALHDVTSDGAQTRGVSLSGYRLREKKSE